MDSTISEPQSSTHDGTLRQYWLLVQSTAFKVRLKEEFLAAGGSCVFTGIGSCVGLILSPGVGGLIGCGLGMIFGALYSVAAAKKRRQKRYFQVLNLSAKEGFKYSASLYELFGGFLSEIQLHQYLASFDEVW